MHQQQQTPLPPPLNWQSRARESESVGIALILQDPAKTKSYYGESAGKMWPWVCFLVKLVSSLIMLELYGLFFFHCVISFPHFIWTVWPLPVSASWLSAAALWLSAYLFLVWLSSICWCETANCLIMSLCLLDSESSASLVLDTISDFAEI